DCLFYWKTAWLKPANDAKAASPRASGAGLSVEDLRRTTSREGEKPGELLYMCQTTEHYRATKPMSYRNPLPYLRDVTSGNYSFGHALGIRLLAGLRITIRRIKGYRAQIALYDFIARRLGKPDYATIVHWRGSIPLDGKTPDGGPNTLRPGDWVRVRPAE